MPSCSGVHTVIDISDQNTGDPLLQKMIALLLQLCIDRQIQIISCNRILRCLLRDNTARSTIDRNLTASLCSAQIILIGALKAGNTDLIIYGINRFLVLFIQFLQLLR